MKGRKVRVHKSTTTASEEEIQDGWERDFKRQRNRSRRQRERRERRR